MSHFEVYWNSLTLQTTLLKYLQYLVSEQRFNDNLKERNIKIDIEHKS